jgi:hypothetical protein
MVGSRWILKVDFQIKWRGSRGKHFRDNIKVIGLMNYKSRVAISCNGTDCGRHRFIRKNSEA